jgi:hypothetical protein
MGTLIDQNVLMGDTSAMPFTSTEIASKFSLTAFNMDADSVIFGALFFGLGTVMALITRQGTYAIYAVVGAVVVAFSGLAQWILGGVGKMTDLLVLGTGLEVFHLGLIFNGFMLAFFFFWLAGILTQRQEMT